MAEKKKTPFKKAKPAAETPKTPIYIYSDKELVLRLEKKAVCISVKKGFVIFDQKEKGKPLHSGIASSSDNAWKLAAHNL